MPVEFAVKSEAPPHFVDEPAAVVSRTNTNPNIVSCCSTVSPSETSRTGLSGKPICVTDVPFRQPPVRSQTSPPLTLILLNRSLQLVAFCVVVAQALRALLVS